MVLGGLGQARTDIEYQILNKIAYTCCSGGILLCIFPKLQ